MLSQWTLHRAAKYRLLFGLAAIRDLLIFVPWSLLIATVLRKFRHFSCLALDLLPSCFGHLVPESASRGIDLLENFSPVPESLLSFAFLLGERLLLFLLFESLLFELVLEQLVGLHAGQIRLFLHHHFGLLSH